MLTLEGRVYAGKTPSQPAVRRDKKWPAKGNGNAGRATRNHILGHNPRGQAKITVRITEGGGWGQEAIVLSVNGRRQPGFLSGAPDHQPEQDHGSLRSPPDLPRRPGALRCSITVCGHEEDGLAGVLMVTGGMPLRCPPG
ncbi:unnamed protein product [Gadus morhua 'NCC']